MDICKIVRKNSGWVWSSLRQAYRIHANIGEESITDFFLLNLRKLATKKLQIISFNRRKEAITGSDWEWWLTGPSNQWLGMRFQAKIISLYNENYEHLHYKSQTQFQGDTLIAKSQKEGLIPLYCMYSYWSPRKQPHKKNFVSHHNGFRVQDFGVSIIDAYSVRSLKSAGFKKNLTDLMPYMKPLHLLFCNISRSEYDLPKVAFRYLEQARFDLDYRALREHAPDYIYQMMEVAERPHIGTEQISFDDSTLRTITVFRQRQ